MAQQLYWQIQLPLLHHPLSILSDSLPYLCSNYCISLPIAVNQQGIPDYCIGYITYKTNNLNIISNLGNILKLLPSNDFM